MTREEAREELITFIGTFECPSLEAVEIAIEALKVEAMQKWVPCSERLPEVGEICLLTVHEYGWNCKDYTRVIIGEYSDNYADHILAWMPLPTPYRERSEE